MNTIHPLLRPSRILLALVLVTGVVLLARWIIELHRTGFDAPEAKRTARAEAARHSAAPGIPESENDSILQSALHDPELFLSDSNLDRNSHASEDATPVPAQLQPGAATLPDPDPDIRPGAGISEEELTRAMSETAHVADGFFSLRREAFTDLAAPQRAELERRMFETTQRQLSHAPPVVASPRSGREQ